MAKRRKRNTKPKSGRPPEVIRHPERVETLVNLVSGGCSLTLACRLTGLARSTVSKWFADAKKPKAPKYILELSSRLKKAQADFVQLHLANIQRASLTEWTASSWLLERTQPEFFAPPAVQLQLRELDRQLRDLQRMVETRRPDGPSKDPNRQQAAFSGDEGTTNRGESV